MIPQAAPPLRIARFRDAVDAAIASVLDGRNYILGCAVANFEAGFAKYCGRAHCVGVASGTEALALTLHAIGIGAGDEVIMPALTFAGAAQAVLHCGAQPRFVDVDPATRCIDPVAVSAALNGRTAAIMPVHLFGQPANMAELMKIAHRHGLEVVEDCAQSHGARLNGRPLGTFGCAAAYSFYPTKNLGCIGDGGAVVTDDAMLADRLRSIRNYGFGPSDRVSLVTGFNSRLDELQAAVLSVLLRHLDDGNAERRAIATRYRARLKDFSTVGLPPEDDGAVYHQFTLTHARRDDLMRHLAGAGIGTAVHYPLGLHRHPAFAGDLPPVMPTTDALCATLISLPIQPEVVEGHVDRIADTVSAFSRAYQ